MKGNPDIVVVEFPALAGYWLSPNHQATNLGFDDVRVRQAMSHAIDRPGLVKALFFGHAAADYGPIAPNWKWYDKRVEQYNQYDPDKAKSLLDAAGWKVGSDGVRAKNGNRLSWTHIGDAGQPDTAGIDVAVAAMLQKVGMDMKVKALPAAQWGSTVTGKTPPASWGFEWLWSSPMDLLVFFYAYPSDKYNGALPRDPRGRQGVADGSLGREAQGRGAGHAGRLGPAPAEGADHDTQRRLRLQQEGHGLPALAEHALPAVQRRLDQRVVPPARRRVAGPAAG